MEHISDNVVNSRLEELNFLISIMTDLIHNYPNHNVRLLEELTSMLKYRKDNEELTIMAKSKSQNKKKGE